MNTTGSLLGLFLFLGALFYFERETSVEGADEAGSDRKESAPVDDFNRGTISPVETRYHLEVVTPTPPVFAPTLEAIKLSERRHEGALLFHVRLSPVQFPGAVRFFSRENTFFSGILRQARGVLLPYNGQELFFAFGLAGDQRDLADRLLMWLAAFQGKSAETGGDLQGGFFRAATLSGTLQTLEASGTASHFFGDIVDQARLLAEKGDWNEILLEGRVAESLQSFARMPRLDSGLFRFESLRGRDEYLGLFDGADPSLLQRLLFLYGWYDLGSEELLAPCLEHPSPPVRLRALEVVRRLGLRQSGQRIAYLHQKEKEGLVRAQQVSTLVALGGENLLATLVANVNDRHPLVRVQAFFGLVTLFPERAEKFALEFTRQTHPLVRFAGLLYGTEPPRAPWPEILGPVSEEDLDYFFFHLRAGAASNRILDRVGEFAVHLSARQRLFLALEFPNLYRPTGGLT